MVFNETLLLPPSETNTPKVHLPFFCTWLASVQGRQASLQAWCLWVRRWYRKGDEEEEETGQRASPMTRGGDCLCKDAFHHRVIYTGQRS